jgi:hypothetical protein
MAADSSIQRARYVRQASCPALMVDVYNKHNRSFGRLVCPAPRQLAASLVCRIPQVVSSC